MCFGLSIPSIPQGALLQQGWQSLDLRIPCIFLQKMAAVPMFCVGALQPRVQVTVLLSPLHGPVVVVTQGLPLPCSS